MKRMRKKTLWLKTNKTLAPNGVVLKVQFTGQCNGKPISFFLGAQLPLKISFIQCYQQSKRPQTFVTQNRVISLVRGVSGSQECVNQCQSSVKYGNASRLDKHTFAPSRGQFLYRSELENILGGEKRAIATSLTVRRAPVGVYYRRLQSLIYEVRSKVKCCFSSKAFRKFN